MNLKSIFIIEDNAIIAMELELFLKNLGFSIFGLFYSGEEALNYFAKINGNPLPEFVLVDIKLSGDIDGIDFVNNIRPKYSVPVIYITGNTDESTKKRAMETDPVAYLKKPINYEMLIDALSS